MSKKTIGGQKDRRSKRIQRIHQNLELNVYA